VLAKGKSVPVENLREWVEVGAGFAGPRCLGTGLPRYAARSEYYGRVLPETIRALPFMPGVAHAVCDGFARWVAVLTPARASCFKRRFRN